MSDNQPAIQSTAWAPAEPHWTQTSRWEFTCWGGGGRGPSVW